MKRENWSRRSADRGVAGVQEQDTGGAREELRRNCFAWVTLKFQKKFSSLAF
jgi:hypothetical protein